MDKKSISTKKYIIIKRKKKEHLGHESDGRTVLLIKTAMTKKTAEGCRIISGHRTFMISVAGQQGLSGNRALLGHERRSHIVMHESNSRGADGVLFD